MSGIAQGVNERMAALTAQGVSVWLDQIRRSLIEGGELQRLIEQDSLRGVTANPPLANPVTIGAPPPAGCRTNSVLNAWFAGVPSALVLSPASSYLCAL